MNNLDEQTVSSDEEMNALLGMLGLLSSEGQSDENSDNEDTELEQLMALLGMDDSSMNDIIAMDFKLSSSSMYISDPYGDDEPVQTLTIKGLVEFLVSAATSGHFELTFSTPLMTRAEGTDEVQAFDGPEPVMTTN